MYRAGQSIQLLTQYHFFRVKRVKEQSLANKTQNREYVCPPACAREHFITKKNGSISGKI